MSRDIVTNLTRRLLLLSRLPGVGKANLAAIGSKAEFARVPDEELSLVFPEIAPFWPDSPQIHRAKEFVERQIEWASRDGIHIVGFWDELYPHLMRASPGSPLIFWYRGDTVALKQPSIAVIGTRHPTDTGKVVSERIAGALATRGLTIVSGLALGLDTCAHFGALQAGGRTLAVLPGGVDCVVPATNRALAHRVVEEGGGLLSEFPLGSKPFGGNFVVRDFTQAAMSTAVVLVQSSEMGGSLHASRAIMKLNRPLFVVAAGARDVKSEASSIRANELLLKGTPAQISKLLGLPVGSGADGIHPLRGRDDYEAVERVAREEWLKAQPKMNTTSWGVVRDSLSDTIALAKS